MGEQSVVGFLLEWMESLYYPNYIPKEIIEQAKEMERQHIMDAFEQGEYTGRGFEDLTSEEYYNINFKSE
jgi:hypothetical protein